MKNGCALNSLSKKNANRNAETVQIAESACKRAIHLIGGPLKVSLISPLMPTRQAISQWRIVPPDRVLTIEAATGGEVTRHDMRPDIFGQAFTAERAAA